MSLGKWTIFDFCKNYKLTGEKCSAEIADDSSLIAIGFADSIVKLWSLTPSKLREMKSADQLKDIDREAGENTGRRRTVFVFTKIIIFHFHRRCARSNDGRSFGRIGAHISRSQWSRLSMCILSGSFNAAILLWRHHNSTVVVAHHDLRCRLQRTWISGVGRTILTAWSLLCHMFSWQNGPFMVNRFTSTFAHIPRTFFRCWCKYIIIVSVETINS